MPLPPRARVTIGGQAIRYKLSFSLDTSMFATLAQQSISGLSLSIEVLQQWFNQRLTESRVGQRYLAGSVNFVPLMPMRSIPFKVVFYSA